VTDNYWSRYEAEITFQLTEGQKKWNCIMFCLQNHTDLRSHCFPRDVTLILGLVMISTRLVLLLLTVLLRVLHFQAL
jgi:hypothetical protein